MVSVGSVRSFDADEGWGVIDGPGVPGGCWVHFSAIAGDGYRQLQVGQRVAFHAEATSQDGFAFRAVKVWTGEVEHAAPIHDQRSASAYHSALFLTADSPADIEPGPDNG
jgi:cold shock protein